MTRPGDEVIAQAFGKRLSEARRKAGLTQEQLAERAGLHPVTISTIETGRRASSVPTLIRLAGALGADASTLVRGLTRDG